jgi:hypothetical protein
VAIDEAAIKAGGQNTDYLPTVLLRRSTIKVAARWPDDAAADAARALSMLQKAAQSGVFSSTLRRAYLTLGKRDEALTAFRSAAEHLEKALRPDHPDARSARESLRQGMQPQ